MAEASQSSTPRKKAMNVKVIPKIGMEFENEDVAYEFYNKYAGEIGFSIRKHWIDKSSTNVIRSRRFVCSREGFREKKDKEKEIKRQRPETRIGCQAQMTIKITPSGKYSVSEFISQHNHDFVSPNKVHLLRSQKKLSEAQKEQIDNMDDSGIAPKVGHEAMSREAGGRRSLSFTTKDYKNYLRTKRMKAIKDGDTGAILEYLQKKQEENPSFSYAIQADENDLMTNIFWADARCVLDYDYFGDVVCFDTTYKTNSYGRPFAPFVGVNHHKQTVIFGAALLYDETTETFKWLFETFKTAMSEKQPKTILTDQCAAMTNAIAEVFPDTTHRLCVWHMYQNAAKHLSHIFQGSKTFKHDFGRCVYDFDDEDEFIAAWEVMLEKYDLKDNKWLERLFNDKEKWALVYGRQTFCADMKSTQRSESINAILKKYLNVQLDLLQFFKHFERVVDDRRYAELEADFRASQTVPTIPPLQMLRQAAKAYTPVVFKMFRNEFEMVMDCRIYNLGQDGTKSTYKILEGDKSKQHEYFVSFNEYNGHALCNCKKFEFVGVQCRHVLKVFDFKNIKELPTKYILKRWRKDAKVGIVNASDGSVCTQNPKSFMAKRYGSLCRTYNKILAKAAESEEAYTLLESMSEQLMKEVDMVLHARPCQDPSVCFATKDSSPNVGGDNTGKNIYSEDDQMKNKEVKINDNIIYVRGVKRKEDRRRCQKRYQNALEKKKTKNARKGNNVLSIAKGDQSIETQDVLQKDSEVELNKGFIGESGSLLGATSSGTSKKGQVSEAPTEPKTKQALAIPTGTTSFPRSMTIIPRVNQSFLHSSQIPYHLSNPIGYNPSPTHPPNHFLQGPQMTSHPFGGGSMHFTSPFYMYHQDVYNGINNLSQESAGFFETPQNLVHNTQDAQNLPK